MNYNLWIKIIFRDLGILKKKRNKGEWDCEALCSIDVVIREAASHVDSHHVINHPCGGGAPAKHVGGIFPQLLMEYSIIP